MSYEFTIDDLHGFVSATGAQVRQKGDELQWLECPYCHGGKHMDKYTFSVSMRNGAFNCKRASCSASGHFVQLCRNFNYNLHFDRPDDREYRWLPQKPVKVLDSAVKYLEGRGISERITRKYSITTKANNSTVLAFPFYSPDGQLVTIKYRKKDWKRGEGSKEWFLEGCKPILFGMNRCADFERLVITEGQIDSLSLSQAGIKNAVSVPNGAKGFTWWQFCAEWVEKFKKVVVFGDNEKGGITLVEELSKRIKKLYVVQQEDYLGEKDANDILRKYGEQALRDAVENAAIQPVERIKRLADVKKVDLDSMPKFKTGVKEVDRIIGGLYFSQVALLTGKRGEGKSTFLSQMIADALDQGARVLAYSGELADYNFRAWLDSQLAGAAHMIEKKNEFGDAKWTIEPEAQERIGKWYSDRAFIYDNAAEFITDSETDSLLDVVEKAIQRYDINLVCIDNLMTALNSTTQDYYRTQSEFVARLKKLAVVYNIVIILVAHPRKSNAEFDNDDVSGSADITNRVDVVLNYARPKALGAEHKGEVSVTKNRLNGALISPRDAVKLTYSESSKRLSSIESGFIDKKYGWETPEDMVEVEEEIPFEEDFI